MSDWLPFEWIAATRFLREGRLQTVAILLGIGIGVGVIIFMSAALAGQHSQIAPVLDDVEGFVSREAGRPARSKAPSSARTARRPGA